MSDPTSRPLPASPPAAPRPALAATAAVFALALLLFGAGAALRDLWRTDEHRYVEVARMMAEGGEWLVPHINGDMYIDKPPGFFWLAGIAHRAGLPLAQAAMAPSVLAGAACVALVFALARRLYGTPEAVAAACVLASSEMFLSLALRANLDALLTFTTTAAVVAYAWLDRVRPGPGRAAWIAAGGVAALAFGTLVKGPVALMVPVATVAGHRLLTRGAERGRVRWPRLVGALVAALALAGLWLLAAWVAQGDKYVERLVLGHGVGHAVGAQDKLEPIWFYIEDFPGGFLPWVALLPAAAARARWPLRSQDALLLAWCALPLIVFSLVPAKRHLYLAPVHPAAALVVARLLGVRLRGLPARSRLESALWTLGRLLLGVAAVAVGAVAALAALLPPDLTGWGAPWTDLLDASRVPRLLAPWLGAGLVAAGAWLLVRRDPRGQARAACTLGALVALALTLVFHPLEAAGRNDRVFYARVAERVPADEPLVSFGGLDFAPNWLLRRDVVPDLQTPKRLERYLEAGDARQRRLWMIAEEGKIERLGLPARTKVVERVPRLLDGALLLLEREPGPSARRDAARTGRDR